MEKNMGQSRKPITHIRKHFFVWAMLMVLTLSEKLPVLAAVTNADLAGPVVNKESHVKGGQHISTYKYVYFGSYPQKEITGDELTDAIKNASYDSNGDGTVNGRRYRRLTYEMTSKAGGINDVNGSKESWNELGVDGYRYFLYEPIKWKILKNENEKLMLLSEYNLDSQYMSYRISDKTGWEGTDLRQWLNCNGDLETGLRKRYKSPGFLNYAFDKAEQEKIQLTHLKQDDNPVYKDTYGNPVSGGEDTYDKIYLLSYSDTNNIDYGFCSFLDENVYGLAPYTIDCSSLEITNTDFSYAMFSRPGTRFWLRTPGKGKYRYMIVNGGADFLEGYLCQNVFRVCPAININYSLSDCIRISFVTNTEVTIEDQILLGSNYAKEPEALTKAGYIFTGWYTDAACTNLYEFNEKLTQDTTLYAGWITPEEEKRLEEEKKRREEIQEQFQVSEETAAKIDQFLQENQIPTDTLAVTDETILATPNDNDIKGSTFGILQARAIKATSKTIKLKWSKVANADGYLIYGNKCGKKNKYELIKTIQNNKTTTFTQKKRKKGTYYKYIVRAYKEFDGKKITVAVSKTVHAATTGGKFGNAKSVKVNKTKVTLKLNKKKQKKYTLKAKEVKQSKKISKHRAIAYESGNPDVAMVSKKGVIQARKKGSCTVYAYAQNGVYKKIKVQVK